MTAASTPKATTAIRLLAILVLVMLSAIVLLIVFRLSGLVYKPGALANVKTERLFTSLILLAGSLAGIYFILHSKVIRVSFRPWGVTRSSAFTPALLLFILSPLFGEYLLGNLKFSEILYLPFIAPLYGAGAILIREITRRLHKGYGTMLALGVAYALVEEGLIDQMLFNHDYYTGQRGSLATIIPGIEVDAWLTLIVIAMHAIWSICIPIVLVEGIYAKRLMQPWLAKPGLLITWAVFLIGSSVLGYAIYQDKHFMTSPVQLLATSLGILAIISAAYRYQLHTLAATAKRKTIPGIIVAIIVFVLSSAYMLTEEIGGWYRVIACLAIIASAITLFVRWLGTTRWTYSQSLAAAAGAALTYSWLGAVMTPDSGPKDTIDHMGTILLIVIVGLLFWTAHRNYNASR